MSQTNTFSQYAKNNESLLVTLAFASSALGLLVFAYLGYIGFVLGLWALWFEFQGRSRKSGLFWYRIFSVIAIVLALVDIAATYFSR